MLKGIINRYLKDRRVLTTLYTLTACLLCINNAFAELTQTTVKHLTVLLSGPEPLYQQTYNTLVEELSADMTLESRLASEWQGETDTDFVVAVGAVATKALLETPCPTAISILLPSNTFANMLQQNPTAATRINQQQLSAIYMDQPGQRQLNLARLIDPSVQKLGTLYDTHSSSLIESLQTAAERQEIDLLARELTPSENPVAALREMYADIDMFIAVPGKFIFNRTTAKWMLYLSYRNRKPLLGFSADYVKAGALAAVYSTPEQLARQAADWVTVYAASGQLPAPGHPARFSISINRDIATRMGKRLPSEDSIQQQLEKMERSQ